MKTTFDRLSTVLLRTYKVDPATWTPNLRLEDLGIDSLGIGLMLFDIEDEFKIKFVSEPQPLLTVGDVVAYIDEVVMTQRLDAGLSVAEPVAPMPAL